MSATGLRADNSVYTLTDNPRPRSAALGFRHQVSIIEQLARAGADTNALTAPEDWETDPESDFLPREHRTPLSFAVDRRQIAAVGLSSADQRGVTVVQALLAAGADVGKLSSWGRSPLMRAVAVANLNFVQLLLRAGADPAARAPSAREGGSTALELAQVKIGSLNAFKRPIIAALEGALGASSQ